jgi:uncharacterized membrane protein
MLGRLGDCGLSLIKELNGFGISLEIIGFILLLVAVKQMPPKGGCFTSDFDYLGNDIK